MFTTSILHCKKLENRLTHILSQITNQNIENYNIVDQFDADDLTEDIICDYYVDNKTECDIASRITLQHNSCIDSVYKTLPKESISLCIKHTIALQSFIHQQDYEYLLILEDDCIFWQNRNINEVIKRAPSDWDIIFIGGSFGYNILPIQRAIGDYILVGHPSTNTTSSLIYNKESAKKTLDTILPFYLPIDWQLNNVFYKNDFKVYHTVPYLCGQLSNIAQGFEGTVKR